ncbi:ATP-binding protein [Pelosinus sp. sgz500959]|uniref:ATP-binding protein n=1 Tax=Pelosinus sp. sgz500959 TaxID=3242472 RepID=UPI00366C3CBB
MSKNVNWKITDDIISNVGWQQYLRAIQALLDGLAVANSKQDFLDMVVKLIQQEGGCKFVGIRVLTEDGYIPYQSYIGFSREFWESENMIQISKEDCSCTRIMSDKLLPFDMPIINSYGSLCCNDTLLFAQTLSEDEQKMYRGACNAAGYRSVAVIPIRDQDAIIGVIHLADYTTDQLSPVIMGFVETIAPLIGKILTMDKIERVLKNTEDKRAILESLVAGISKLAYIVDMDTYELIYVSKATESLYSEKMAGRKCYQIFGKTFPCSDCSFQKEQPDIGFNWERYDEVHDRHYLCEQQAIKWPDGRLVPTVFVTDITQQREAEKAENALKETLRKFQVFFVHSRDIMLFIDWTSGNIIEANPAAATSYGYSREELLTQNISDLRVEQRQRLIREQMDTAFKDGITFEAIHRCKDGRTFPVEVNSRGEQVGQTRILFSVIRDITERRAAQEGLRKLNAELENKVAERTSQLQEINAMLEEEIMERQAAQELLRKLNAELECRVAERTAELEESNATLEEEIIERRASQVALNQLNSALTNVNMALEEEFIERQLAEKSLQETQAILQAALDNCQAGIAVADAPDGKLRYLNKAGQLITNHSGEYFNMDVNDHLKNWNIFHENGIPLKNHEVPLVRAIRYGETYSDEFIIRRENCKDLAIWANAAPIKDEAGKVKAGIVIFLDISERKRIEKALLKAKEEAEWANTAKSQFLANMSHEIRTPMNGIIGMTDITLMTDLQENQREYLNIVKSSTMALLRVVNDILDYSKIEAGKIELAEDIFDIWETTNDVIELFTIAAKQKGLCIKLNIDKEVPRIIIGDSVRLRQVLSNLVGNGVKFTQQGEIVIHIRVAEKYNGKVKLIFVVADTGIGISDDKIEKLFKRFSQVDDSHTKQFGGTGLGLAISKKLIEIMNGEIGVESKEGIGSRFFFTAVFGVHKEFELCKKEIVFHERIQYKNPGLKTVLLAEDDLVSRNMVTTLLKKNGFKVIAVENGKEAIDAFEKEKIDVILMDINMPYLDGYSATKEIKSREKDMNCCTPIIAMTAYALKGDREKCLAVGMDDYISKPININQVIDIIQKYLKTGSNEHNEV